MKFCTAHWQELQSLIKDRGLWGLVSHTGEEAVERFNADQSGGGPENFDPLLQAHNFLSTECLANGGAYLLTDDYCPLCEFDKHKAIDRPDASAWMAKTIDRMLEHCQKEGLVPGRQ